VETQVPKKIHFALLRYYEVHFSPVFLSQISGLNLFSFSEILIESMKEFAHYAAFLLLSSVLEGQKERVSKGHGFLHFFMY